MLDDYPNVDGVIPLVHGTGCGIDAKGEGYEVLKRTAMGLCRQSQYGRGADGGAGLRDVPDRPLEGGLQYRRKRHVPHPDDPGDRRHAKDGRGWRRARCATCCPPLNSVERETAPASELMLALQCGGSDGYSGITANPALGAAVDMLVRHGGTAILSETPEIYGAEHLLTRRAATPEVGKKLIERIRWWEDYTARNGGEMNNNPSPGNKAGGLTTILEKSLGAAAKGGTTRAERGL